MRFPFEMSRECYAFSQDHQAGKKEPFVTRTPRPPGMMKRQQRIQGINGLSEQLQSYPLNSSIRCCAEQDTHLSGYVHGKGKKIIFCLTGMGKRPKTWGKRDEEITFSDSDSKFSAAFRLLPLNPAFQSR